ncbi:hypothetical protein GMD62_09265 [Pseudoflavonifractor sp. BIOML-A14]|nr:hypothetical protein [Pseudoflavonifractor sp. BIOML-A14]
MVSVKDLLELDAFRAMELAAGRRGLHRRVSWPNIAQTESIREGLMGGDVILMTGGGLAHTAEFLNHIVRQAVEGEAACLIIWLCDDLIAQIPPETAALADELRLPLLTAPWDTHIAGLIGEISTRILTDQYGENAMNELLEMLLFQREPVPEELMAAFVEKYRLTGRHLVAAAECRWESGGDGEGPMGELPSRRQVNSLIIQSLKSAFPQTYYISRNWNPVFLLRLEKRQEAALREVLLAVREKAARDYPRLEVRFGVGGACGEPALFARSCREAMKALSLCGPEGVTAFSELGIFQLLMEVPDQKRVREYALAQLEPLIAYDAKYGKNLLRTLEVYLQANCSLVRTAQRMYLHRNTLAYRLEKIRELLDLPIEEAQARNHLYNCLKIYRYGK